MGGGGHGQARAGVDVVTGDDEEVHAEESGVGVSWDVYDAILPASIPAKPPDAQVTRRKSRTRRYSSKKGVKRSFECPDGARRLPRGARRQEGRPPDGEEILWRRPPHILRRPPPERAQLKALTHSLAAIAVHPRRPPRRLHESRPKTPAAIAALQCGARRQHLFISFISFFH